MLVGHAYSGRCMGEVGDSAGLAHHSFCLGVAAASRQRHQDESRPACRNGTVAEALGLDRRLKERVLFALAGHSHALLIAAASRVPSRSTHGRRKAGPQRVSERSRRRVRRAAFAELAGPEARQSRIHSSCMEKGTKPERRGRPAQRGPPGWAARKAARPAAGEWEKRTRYAARSTNLVLFLSH